MKEAFVSIYNLNLKYQQKMVLQDLNWTIFAGDNWGLSGSSGTGKTSLAKIIIGQLSAFAEIKINFDHNSQLPAKAIYVESWYHF